MLINISVSLDIVEFAYTFSPTRRENEGLASRFESAAYIYSFATPALIQPSLCTESKSPSLRLNIWGVLPLFALQFRAYDSWGSFQKQKVD